MFSLSFDHVREMKREEKEQEDNTHTTARIMSECKEIPRQIKESEQKGRQEM